MVTSDQIRDLFLPIISQPMTIEDIVAKITNIFLLFAGIIAFFYLLYAGILYITAGASAEQSKKAQAALINVVIGILVIALSYLIIVTVSGYVIRIFQ